MSFRLTSLTRGTMQSSDVAPSQAIRHESRSPVREEGAPPSMRQAKGPMPVAVIKVPKFWPSSRPAEPQSAHSDEGLDAFGSEAGSPESSNSTSSATSESGVAQPRPTSGTAALTWALAFLACAGLTAVAVWQYQIRVSASALGSLTLRTVPDGADVLIAGKPSGHTPLTTNLPAGAYDIQVVLGGQKRDLKVMMAAGVTTVHQLEFPVAPPPVPVTAGALHVQADFRLATVAVDGVERGSSPITIEGLTPGDHDVVVRGDRGTFRRSVLIKPQETLSLVISPSEPAASLPGWLAISSPIVMQLREAGRIVGTTESDRLMMPAGEHEIEIVNEALGVQSIQKVAVVSGKTTTTSVELPTGLLSLNALPWAEVWVDGERIGETPIANLSRRVGTHQVVFRHPQFGERTETVVVTLRQPARLGIDMRRQKP